jgi:hypothetical protein
VSKPTFRRALNELDIQMALAAGRLWTNWSVALFNHPYKIKDEKELGGFHVLNEAVGRSQDMMWIFLVRIDSDE